MELRHWLLSEKIHTVGESAVVMNDKTTGVKDAEFSRADYGFGDISTIIRGKLLGERPTFTSCVKIVRIAALKRKSPCASASVPVTNQ